MIAIGAFTIWPGFQRYDDTNDLTVSIQQMHSRRMKPINSVEIIIEWNSEGLEMMVRSANLYSIMDKCKFYSMIINKTSR